MSRTSAPPENWPAPWRSLVDDAAIFPPGNVPLDEAITAHREHQAQWYSDLVGSFVVTDVDLTAVPEGMPASVVLTTGAGAVEGVVHLAARRNISIAGLEVALRDLDDLPGNARRIDAAVRASGLDVPVHIEIPGPAAGSWLGAADEVAACGHRVKLRLGNVDHDLIPDLATVVGWIDAALDRETAFKATAGLHRAVRHDPEGGGLHGFLNVLVATAVLWDGGSRDDAVAALDQRDGAALVARVSDRALVAARRWFTSFGSCSVTEPLDDLIALGLIPPHLPSHTMEQP